MEQYYEKCISLEKKYLITYNKLLSKFNELENDYDKDELQQIKNKYLSKLLSKNDLDELNRKKNKILQEYNYLKKLEDQEFEDTPYQI